MKWVPAIEPSQFVLLSVLAHISREAPQVMLGEALGYDKTTLSRSLRLMQKNGWVTVSSSKDARERGYRLTSQGARMLQAAKPRWQGAQDKVRGAMTPRRVGRGGEEHSTFWAGWQGNYVRAESNRLASSGNEAVGPSQRNRSTSSKSGMLARNVARSRNSSAKSRCRESVCPSDRDGSPSRNVLDVAMLCENTCSLTSRPSQAALGSHQRHRRQAPGNQGSIPARRRTSRQSRFHRGSSSSAGQVARFLFLERTERCLCPGCR